MAKVGRPTIKTKKLTEEIMSRLAEGQSMRTVCKDPGMPAMQTMWRWIREDKQFGEQYARAKQESADALAEEILDISDEKVDKVGVQRNRLRVDTRKWLMAKQKPKKYSDYVKVDEESTVTHKWESLTDAQLQKAIEERQNRTT